MFSISYNTLVVLLGTSLLGAGAGLVGSFTVLRSRALVGDVLAHAALPGICLAVWIMSRRELSFMLLGALATGVVAVLLMTFLRRATRVKDDAVMGSVRSVFFCLGVVLMSLLQNRTVEGSKAGLESYILGKTAGMLASDVYLIAGVALAALVCIALLYKELRLASFDAGFARVQGWPALLLDNVQMLLAALMTVIGLPAVGAVLMAAMLILPSVTMRFWTERLGTLLVGSSLLGAAVGALGTAASANLSLLPAGPIIILVGSIAFVSSLLFAPRRGLIARGTALSRFRRRLLQQRLLRLLYEQAERPAVATPITEESLPRFLNASLRRARRTLYDGLLSGTLELRRTPADVRLSLTHAGERHAAEVTRGYRLWTAFLERYPDQSGSLTDLDLRLVDELLPDDTVSLLEDELRASGRLPAAGVRA